MFVFTPCRDDEEQQEDVKRKYFTGARRFDELGKQAEEYGSGEGDMREKI